MGGSPLGRVDQATAASPNNTPEIGRVGYCRALGARVSLG